MTRLRPLAVPAAAVVLATTGTPSAHAQPSRPVVQPAAWGLQSTVPVDVHLDSGSDVAATVPSAMSLPPVALVDVVEPGATGARHAAAPTPAGVVAAGPPLLATARGPPA